MMAAPVWLLVVTAVIVILLFKIVHFFYWLRKATKMLEPIPVAFPLHWLYGTIPHMIDPQYNHKVTLWGCKNGIRVSREWWGPIVPGLVIHHPDVWKEVLNKHKSVETYNKILEPWLGKGLLIAGGQKWARNRKLLTAAFHFQTLKPYVQIYNDCADVLIKKWRKSITNGQSIAVYSDTSRLALDVILKCSFSYKSDCQLKDAPYTKAIHHASISFRERYCSVILRTLHNFIYYNFTSHGRKCKKSYDYVHRYAETIIAERKKVLSEQLETDATVDLKDVMAQAVKKGNRKCLDFLDILLMARDEDGRGLTDIEIRYEVDTFLFEGHDTTAHGLAWTLYCLAGHPEHQQKCREEVNEVLGEKDHLEYDDLAKLTYTQWCIKESMRLYPPVYAFVREVNEDTTIDGHSVPSGTQISVVTLHINHNKEFWSEPEVFDPDRFSPDRMANQHPYAYATFSAGPRNCIGQNFAMNEMRVTIGMILRNFKLSLDKEKPAKVFPGVLYGFKNDLHLNIEPVCY